MAGELGWLKRCGAEWEDTLVGVQERMVRFRGLYDGVLSAQERGSLASFAESISSALDACKGAPTIFGPAGEDTEELRRLWAEDFDASCSHAAEGFAGVATVYHALSGHQLMTTDSFSPIALLQLEPAPQAIDLQGHVEEEFEFDAPPRAVSFPCNETGCGRRAAMMRLGISGGAAVLELTTTRPIRYRLDADEVEELSERLSAGGNELLGIDETYMSFYCSGCAAPYCDLHWDHDDHPDFDTGDEWKVFRCPRRHEKEVWTFGPNPS